MSEVFGTQPDATPEQGDRGVMDKDGTTRSFVFGAAPSEVPTNEIWEQEYLAQNGGTVPEVDQPVNQTGYFRFSNTENGDRFLSFEFPHQGSVNDWHVNRYDGDGSAPLHPEAPDISGLLWSTGGSGYTNHGIAFGRRPGNTFRSANILIAPFQGSLFGVPSGGSQGSGTLNAEELYDNGHRVLSENTEVNFRQNVDGAGIGFGTGIRSSGRGELFIHSSADDRQAEIHFGWDANQLGNSDNINWTLSDRGNENARFIMYAGPGLTGGGFDSVLNVDYDNGTASFNFLGELYENGNRVVTDYVFDAELDGDVDTAHYDALMGEREIEEGEDEDGNPKVRREKQTHRPAHTFRENASELEPTEFAKRWRQSRKLPAMERCESSLREGQERPSLGQTLQAVLETCEVQAVHIDRLEKRIRQLESDRARKAVK